DPGGLEPGGPGTDDDDVLGALAGIVGDLLGQVGLPAAGGIVDAGRRSRGVDGIEAHVRAHAGADVVLRLLLDLPHQIGVGQLRAGHAHEIEAPVLDGEPGGRGIGDAGGVEDGDVDGLTDPAAGLQPRGRGCAHARYRLGEFAVGADGADVEVEEVDAV